MTGFDPQQRRQLLDAVAQWLDTVAEAEPPPSGVAPELLTATAQAPDLFSLLNQLTALTRETQLQGRATNRLHSELTGKLDTVSERLVSVDSNVAKVSDVRRQARLEVVGDLLDIRDRFVRGLDEAQRRLGAVRGWLARFAQRPVLEALVQGNLLARERLDDVLRRLEVQEIPCLGKPFDPTLMQATEVEHSSTVPAGSLSRWVHRRRSGLAFCRSKGSGRETRGGTTEDHSYVRSPLRAVEEGTHYGGNHCWY